MALNFTHVFTIAEEEKCQLVHGSRPDLSNLLNLSACVCQLGLSRELWGDAAEIRRIRVALLWRVDTADTMRTALLLLTISAIFLCFSSIGGESSFVFAFLFGFRPALVEQLWNSPQSLIKMIGDICQNSPFFKRRKENRLIYTTAEIKKKKE